MPGWTIYIDANENGHPDIGELSTVTDTDGNYAFLGLDAGNYLVSELPQSGWHSAYASGQPSDGRVFMVLSIADAIVELNPQNGALLRTLPNPARMDQPVGLAVGPYSIFLSGGVEGTITKAIWELDLNTGEIIDFDELQPSSVAIQDLAYLNGKLYLSPTSTSSSRDIQIWDPASDALVGTLAYSSFSNYAGISGAADLGVLLLIGSTLGNHFVVQLDPATNFYTPTTVIGPTGSYGFHLGYSGGEVIANVTNTTVAQFHRFDAQTGVLTATVTPSGWSGLPVSVGGDGVTPVAFRRVTLEESQVLTGIELSAVQLASLSGSLWNDQDRDGTRDAGEPPLEGWTAFIDVDQDGALDNTEISTITDANGDYEFEDLPPGEYKIAAVVPGEWAQTSPVTAATARRLYQATSSIRELDPKTGEMIRGFSSPVNPTTFSNMGLAAGPSSLFYLDVISSSPPVLYELDPVRGNVVDADPLSPGIALTGGLAHLNGQLYLTATQSGTAKILVWDPLTDTFVNTLTINYTQGFLHQNASGLTGAEDRGVLYASSYSDNWLYEINPLTGAITRVLLPSLPNNIFGLVGLAYVGRELYVQGSSIYRIDPDTGSYLGAFQTFNSYLGGLAGDGAGPLGLHTVSVAGQDISGLDFGIRQIPEITTPPGLFSLQAASDTGSSTSDRITRFNNSSSATRLSFRVLGAPGGSTLRLYADGQLVGTGTGFTLTSNGTSALSDGVHTFTVTAQQTGKEESNPLTLLVTIDTTAPVPVIEPPSPQERATPVSDVSIAFGEKVNGFDLADLVLTRDGGANLLTASQTLTSTNGNVSFALSGLSSLTGTHGTYTLQLSAGSAQITDVAGNAMLSSASIQFTNVLGDMNGDGALNNFDIQPFEIALTDEAHFQALYATVDGAFRGDANLDGIFNNFDIQPFELLLTTSAAAELVTGSAPAVVLPAVIETEDSAVDASASAQLAAPARFDEKRAVEPLARVSLPHSEPSPDLGPKSVVGSDTNMRLEMPEALVRDVTRAWREELSTHSLLVRRNEARIDRAIDEASFELALFRSPWNGSD